MLAWPRTGVSDKDGRVITNTMIPTDIESATAEMAKSILSTDPTTDDADLGLRHSREKVRTLEVEKTFDGWRRDLPDFVLDILKPFLVDLDNWSVRLVS